jgi:hypothetical protein
MADFSARSLTRRVTAPPASSASLPVQAGSSSRFHERTSGLPKLEQGFSLPHAINDSDFHLLVPTNLDHRVGFGPTVAVLQTDDLPLVERWKIGAAGRSRTYTPVKANDFKSSSSTVPSQPQNWSEMKDSNLHGLLHSGLSRERLPVPANLRIWKSARDLNSEVFRFVAECFIH